MTNWYRFGIELGGQEVVLDPMFCHWY